MIRIRVVRIVTIRIWDFSVMVIRIISINMISIMITISIRTCFYWFPLVAFFLAGGYNS